MTINSISEAINQNINILFTDTSFFPKVVKEQCDGNRIIDLLLYLPFRYSHKKIISKLREIRENDNVILTGIVAHMDLQHQKVSKIHLQFDGDVSIEIIYFRGNKYYLQKIYNLGAQITVSGKIVKNGYYWQITHPDYVCTLTDNIVIPKIESFYHLSKSLTNKLLIGLIDRSFKLIKGDFPEWIASEILIEKNWPSFLAALKILHQIEQETYDENLVKLARERLIFDEFLANQLALKLLRANFKIQYGRSLVGDNNLRTKILGRLPFELTNDQQQVLKDIYEDQKSKARMLRMLQGDVGSGKTIIAILALLNVVECGLQSILMAPTEILAQQHFEYVSKLLADTDITVVFLASSSRKKKDKMAAIESGEAQIIIGTHALFQNKMKFKEVGLIVIDEQHRFGVNSRQMLADKDIAADLLLMSATPIPRSLAMAQYGFLDHSLLVQKPLGRKEIITNTIANGYVKDLIGKIHDFIARNERIYWVCPLINESLKLDLIAIEKRSEILLEHFGESLAIIHGKMKDAEIAEIMQQFISGEKKLLLSTTLIEVGVNVPEATLIIIEDAQRFGLSQIHQLRGRVGRSDLQSYCILLYNDRTISVTGKRRLKVLKESNDGFYIAEADLKIRGSGEFTGYRQSGFNSYRVAEVGKDMNLLKEASNYARDIIQNSSNIAESYKLLMNIFSSNAEIT